MKPERIQLGLKSLVHWRQSAETEQAIVRHYRFVNSATTVRFLRESLEMAEKQKLPIELHLKNDALSARLPGDSISELTERHLELARAIESRALGVKLVIRNETSRRHNGPSPDSPPISDQELRRLVYHCTDQLVDVEGRLDDPRLHRLTGVNISGSTRTEDLAAIILNRLYHSSSSRWRLCCS